MPIHASAAIALGEPRTAVALIRTWTFIVLAISFGLVCYVLQSQPLGIVTSRDRASLLRRDDRRTPFAG